MPRKPLIRSNEHYYHVTARSNNRENFYLSPSVIWIIFLNELASLQKKFQIKIAAFVLMDNHFHLLVLSPEEDIDKIMYFFMKNSTLDIQKKSGRINKIFGGRYKGSLILNNQYLFNVYQYIYLNPVRAKIVKVGSDYPLSSFYFIKNNLQLPINISSPLGELDWLNSPLSKNDELNIKSALRKTIFTPPRNKSSGKIYTFDDAPFK